MTADDHRDWRLSLGAYALGDLPADERAALAAHIEGCPECRAELRELEGVGFESCVDADPFRHGGELDLLGGRTFPADRQDDDRQQRRDGRDGDGAAEPEP